MTSWYVVNTKPHQEKRAEYNLRQQGFHTWLPVMERTRRHARRIDTVQEPVFPSYLFVEIDLERQKWSVINGTFGVKYLLGSEHRPQPLPEQFVDALRQTTNADGLMTPGPNDVNVGEKVKITKGPFVDYVGVVTKLSRGERVSLLLDVLGGTVSTTISTRAIVPTA